LLKTRGKIPPEQGQEDQELVFDLGRKRGGVGRALPDGKGKAEGGQARIVLRIRVRVARRRLAEYIGFRVVRGGGEAVA